MKRINCIYYKKNVTTIAFDDPRHRARFAAHAAAGGIPFKFTGWKFIVDKADSDNAVEIADNIDKLPDTPAFEPMAFFAHNKPELSHAMATI